MTTTLYLGDCLDVLPTLAAQSVHCCVTSPPYWGLRDYGVSGQLGLEPTPEEYVAHLVAVFREVRRVLRDDGTLWLNMGDSYAGSGKGHTKSGTIEGYKQATNRGSATGMPAMVIDGLKPKDLVGIPWRVAFALQADGWYLRSDIIWAKPNPMPESVTDRPTKAHEYLFLLAKSARYYYDYEAVKEPMADTSAARYAYGFGGVKNEHLKSTDKPTAVVGNKDAGDGKRNRRDVWTITTKPYKGAHFATMPPDLVEPCILAGCPAGGVVLDPFCGSGTVGEVATRLGRSFVGIDLNPDYRPMQEERIAKGERAWADVQAQPLLLHVETSA